MESDGDEDFVVSGPTKKVKKNAGEDKGKKKKSSATKGDRISTSPKRKTPARKKKEEKDDGKKVKGKAKPKKVADEGQEEELGSETPEVADTANIEEPENFEPTEEERSGSDTDEEAQGKSKNKKEKKEVKKAKKEKGEIKDQDQEDILEYMKKQNRPYSIQNIFDNLHAKIKKGNCQKALDNLVDNGHLQAKEFGKAKLYLLNQQNIPQVGAKEMEKLKENLNDVKLQHSKLADEVKEMNLYLKNLNNQLSNEQLNEEAKKYQDLVNELNKKLEIYESGNYPKISDEQMKVVEEKKKKFEMEYKKRKRMCLNMLNTIADSMETKLANLIEMVGIEED